MGDHRFEDCFVGSGGLQQAKLRSRRTAIAQKFAQRNTGCFGKFPQLRLRPSRLEIFDHLRLVTRRLGHRHDIARGAAGGVVEDGDRKISGAHVSVLGWCGR